MENDFLWSETAPRTLLELIETLDVWYETFGVIVLSSVTQLVENGTYNARAVGSIPLGGPVQTYENVCTHYCKSLRDKSIC